VNQPTDNSASAAYDLMTAGSAPLPTTAVSGPRRPSRQGPLFRPL